MSQGITCPQCSKFYAGHSNDYGKVCIACRCLIPASHQPTTVAENELKLKLLQQQLIDKLRGSQTGGNKPMEKYANSK